MKKIYMLALGLAGFAGVANAQFNSKSDAESLIHTAPAHIQKSEATNVLRGSGTCADTNNWTWARSLQQDPNTGQVAASYFTFPLHNDSLNFKSYGTYVDVPANTTVEVSGFDFYGFSYRPDGNAVTVNAVIYAAGADSLPTGNPLATVAVNLDTATFLNQMLKSAVFTTPVTVNGSFVLSIENSLTVGDSCAVIRGYTGSGVADGFPSVFEIDLLGAGYTRLAGFNEGARLPHFYPYVSFAQTNGFTMSTNKLTGPNETVDFTYEAPSVTDHPVWSISGYIGDTTSTWTMDGMSFKDRSTSYTFADASQDYTITLVDTVALWNGVCVMTESKVLEKADPNSIAGVDQDAVKAFVANGNIVLKNGSGVATVYALNGAVKSQVLVNNSTEVINTSDYTPGIYIVNMNDKVWKLKL